MFEATNCAMYTCGRKIYTTTRGCVLQILMYYCITNKKNVVIEFLVDKECGISWHFYVGSGFERVCILNNDKLPC